MITNIIRLGIDNPLQGPAGFVSSLRSKEVFPHIVAAQFNTAFTLSESQIAAIIVETKKCLHAFFAQSEYNVAIGGIYVNPASFMFGQNFDYAYFKLYTERASMMSTMIAQRIKETMHPYTCEITTRAIAECDTVIYGRYAPGSLSRVRPIDNTQNSYATFNGTIIFEDSRNGFIDKDDKSYKYKIRVNDATAASAHVGDGVIKATA